ncbi:hypothetical protein EFV61_09655 [Yersinia enterocolitica]|nr:hypothetical protein [Yersinia enterocolitica]EKN4925814.1 hypothetical protein [Yersinia enterocolitica]EKN4930186.1 hypothetical protein [Yersinia enterocolitica]EKN5013159.1 hypothetical protein [Yersinia enterocolitica]EKN5024571.1 hypothetical protein [Yersinia enterocolitica]
MGLASARPLPAAFKSAPDRFVTRITYSCKFIGIMSLIRGSPCGPAQAPFKMVCNQFVIYLPPSCNSNYLGYILSYVNNNLL